MSEPSHALDGVATEKSTHRLIRSAPICVTVFLTGAAVLVLEILGTRLLSPHFGNNLLVWSALISVTMIALAMGYWIGGRLADSRAKPELLDKVIAGSALWVALIPTLVQAVSGPLLEADYRIGVLLAALISFGPALFLLGMVTPIAVKLSVSDLTHVGRSSGMVYACSTSGGIFGALGAGFLLFPVISVTRICHVTALLLLAVAATRWLVRSRHWGVATIPGLFLALACFASPDSVLPKRTWEEGGFRIIDNRPSYYGTVRVVEFHGNRMLTIDGMCHNAQAIVDRSPVMPHIWVFGALPYLRPGSERALLIGLGGGDLVGLLKDFGIRTVAVEIDPVVVDAAFGYFGLKEQDVSVTVGDGRLFLRSNSEQFDYVIVDAFMGGMVPAHLFTVEAFREMKLRLKPGGVVAFNIAVSSAEGPLVNDLVETLRAVFPEMILVTTIAEGDKLGNMIVFASDAPLAFPDQWWPAPKEPRITGVLERLPQHVIDHRKFRGTVITDELNPVEAYSVPTEIALRMDSRSMLPPSLLEP